jgi:hypothetical protein
MMENKKSISYNQTFALIIEYLQNNLNSYTLKQLKGSKEILFSTMEKKLMIWLKD